jgi:ADP-ribose pyrophosphatase YjhB (NUDIX family)
MKEYRNPTPTVDVILERDSNVLMVRRKNGEIRAGDDAANIEWIKLANIRRQQIAFDHTQILSDYQYWKASGGTFWSTKRRND